MTIMVDSAQLAIAAEQLFHRLQTIQEFKTIRVLIIGDLAAWKYIAKRNISDIDILVELGPGFNPRLSELPTGATEPLKLGLTVSYPEEFYQPVAIYISTRSGHLQNLQLWTSRGLQRAGI
ncbi:hypothetical protein AWENTII_010549 [Aspergillus wentii]|nr:hypothetical protein MW887_009723 [Aspergillus wentii]